MALPKQDTTGEAVPVSLISAWTAGLLVPASGSGYVTMSDGTKVSPLDFYSAVFPEPDDPTDPDPTACSLAIIILNALSTPLSLVEMHDLVHGVQKAYPVVANLQGDTLKTTHEIPASRSHPLDPSETLYGLGMWGFDAVTNGEEGAMALCYNGNLTDPQSKQAVGPFVGVSWRHVPVFADRYGVTADVAGKYGTLDDFYQKTIVSASDSTRSDKSDDIVIQCHEGWANLKSGLNPPRIWLMVYVRNRLPSD